MGGTVSGRKWVDDSASAASSGEPIRRGERTFFFFIGVGDGGVVDKTAYAGSQNCRFRFERRDGERSIDEN